MIFFTHTLYEHLLLGRLGGSLKGSVLKHCPSRYVVLHVAEDVVKVPEDTADLRRLKSIHEKEDQTQNVQNNKTI